MKISNLINASMCALLLSSPTLAFDLKGVEVGKPADAAQIQSAFSLDTSRPGDSGVAHLAGVQAEINVDIDATRILQSINATFAPNGYESIDTALRAKYGKPGATEREPVTNAFGASLTRIIETWTNAAGDRMTLVRYLTATECMLLIQSRDDVEKSAARNAKAAGDI